MSTFFDKHAACDGCGGVERTRAPKITPERLSLPRIDPCPREAALDCAKSFEIPDDLIRGRATIALGQPLPRGWENDKADLGLNSSGFVLIDQARQSEGRTSIESRYFPEVRLAATACLQRAYSVNEGHFQHPAKLEEVVGSDALNNGQSTAMLLMNSDRFIALVSAAITPENLSILMNESPVKRPSRSQQ